MTVLWTRNDAAKATGGHQGDAGWAATGVSIDSRTLKPGDLFVALAGPNFDGHDYVAAALAAGAAAAMVHRIPGDADSSRLLVVPDTMAALGALGAFARARCAARIVAVTGSVGKTSTKEMLKLVLSDQGATHASEGSLNNHWGVPLSLARMPADCAFAILEMGMNHAGELAPLSRLARPHVAVITTVEAVHCEFFASVAGIADAKAEIFAGLETGGTAVLNRDNPFFDRLTAAARAAGAGRVDGFGWHIESAARLLDCALDPKSSSVFALIGDDTLSYRLSVPGLQWVMNSLCVLLAARAAGADLARAAASLAHMRPPHGRGERFCLPIPGGSVEIIDESYNASPVSMRAAFHTLSLAKPAKGARRIAVLGDMLELGAHSEALHAALAAPLAERGIDLVFTAGTRMRTLHEALPGSRRGGHADSSDLLAPLVLAALLPGDVVMVKGSAGSRMSRVVKVLLGEA